MTDEAQPLDKQYIASVAKAVQILSCFRPATPLLGNQDIATRCGMPKSTVARFLYTLSKLDCLEYDNRHDKYRLGSRIATLGHSRSAGDDIAGQLQPAMRRLALQHDCLVTLGAYEDASIVCLAGARGPSTQAPSVEPGMHVSVFSTAMGRAYLASCGRLERQRILDQAVRRKPAEAEALGKMVQSAVAEYSRRGVCTTIEGWRRGHNGIAVPLFLKQHGRRLTLGCGAPSRELTPERVFDGLSQALLATANEIEIAFERRSRVARMRQSAAARL